MKKSIRSSINNRAPGMQEKDSMAYRIYVSDDSSYIILEVSGGITRRRQLQRTIEAHQLGRKVSIRKYLVDVTRAENEEPPIENYKFAYEDVRGADEIDKTAIVALVVAPQDHSHDFVETVSKNSGLNVTLFRDKSRAVDFLRNC
jgi:hypothetical protein